MKRKALFGCQQDRGTLWKTQLTPRFRHMGNSQQRSDCPEQDQKRQNRKQDPAKGCIPNPQQRICRQSFHNMIQSYLQQHIDLFHSPLLSGSNPVNFPKKHRLFKRTSVIVSFFLPPVQTNLPHPLFSLKIPSFFCRFLLTCSEKYIKISWHV